MSTQSINRRYDFYQKMEANLRRLARFLWVRFCRSLAIAVICGFAAWAGQQWIDATHPPYQPPTSLTIVK